MRIPMLPTISFLLKIELKAEMAARTRMPILEIERQIGQQFEGKICHGEMCRLEFSQMNTDFLTKTQMNTDFLTSSTCFSPPDTLTWLGTKQWSKSCHPRPLEKPAKMNGENLPGLHLFKVVLADWVAHFCNAQLPAVHGKGKIKYSIKY
jgi:hypothetical protein